MSRPDSWATAEETALCAFHEHEERRGYVVSESTMIPLNDAEPRVSERALPADPLDDVRFGFAGPIDCIMSLNMPAEGVGGHKHPSTRFEIEFDPENPENLAVSLLDLDEAGFSYTVQRSISFPAKLVAELLSRRKATAEEAAEWQIPDECE
jgi:hypothetical protein